MQRAAGREARPAPAQGRAARTWGPGRPLARRRRAQNMKLASNVMLFLVGSGVGVGLRVLSCA
jgi:hypothetical protein